MSSFSFYFFLSYRRSFLKYILTVNDCFLFPLWLFDRLFWSVPRGWGRYAGAAVQIDKREASGKIEHKSTFSPINIHHPSIFITLFTSPLLSIKIQIQKRLHRTLYYWNVTGDNKVCLFLCLFFNNDFYAINHNGTKMCQGIVHCCRWDAPIWLWILGEWSERSTC